MPFLAIVDSFSKSFSALRRAHNSIGPARLPQAGLNFIQWTPPKGAGWVGLPLGKRPLPLRKTPDQQKAVVYRIVRAPMTAWLMMHVTYGKIIMAHNN